MWLWTWVVFATAAAACAQQFPFVQVPGAPHGIYTLMQDSRSAIWLGTIDDVLRFDGERFYSLRAYGFPMETPNSFAEDSDGGIWIATQGTDANGGTKHGGLYRYQAGKVAKVFDGDVLTIAAFAQGVLVASVGTEVNGRPTYGDLYLFRKSGSEWTVRRLLEKRASHLTLDHQGNLLFPCPEGWCEVAQQELLAASGDAALRVQRHAASPQIERVLRDRDGCTWFRAEAFANYQCPADSGLQTLPGGITQYDSSSHLEEGPDGSILMLVALAYGRPGDWHVATGSNGMPEPIDTAMVAKDGTIWIGAESGLYRFMYPFRLEYWGQESGAGSPGAILRVGNDTFAAHIGVLRLNQNRNRWDMLPGTVGLGGVLAAGPHGTLFASAGNRLALLSPQGKMLAQLSVDKDMSAGMYLTMARNGEVWLGRKGMNRVMQHGSELTLQPEPLPPARVHDVRYDFAHDTLWACYGNGVAFRRNGVWNRITPQDGLLDFPCESLGIEANGDVWVGYQVNAFSWISNPSSGPPAIKNYTQWLNEVVQNGLTHLMDVDRRGWLWRGSDALRIATPGAPKAGNWIKLDQQDGFSPPWVDEHPFLAEDDGSVWLGTSNQIVHFSPPADFLTRFPAPPVFVAGFSAARRGTVLADAVGRLPHEADVVAHIGSMQFDRRNAMHIRYRLLPEQSSWTNADGFDARLGRLRWGHHTLEVQAQLATGPWSAAAVQSLDVEAPFWFSWEALLGFAVMCGGAAAYGYRWTTKRRSRAARKLPELAEWRLAALSPELQQLDGTLLDKRFETGQVLARGGFATVVKGRDLQEGGRACAVKIFRQELVDKAWITRRFRQEVLALAKIQHPNVVRIYGHGETPWGSSYLAMEFIDGKTLRQILEEGPLAAAQTASYLRQTGRALDLIHEHGVCHRDLKPENLMVRSNSAPGEELVLIDFSIAIVKDPDETMHGLSRAAGTLYYMAPEQAIGFASSSTDIYSLAKIVMEMLTGHRLSELLPDASMDLPEKVREYLSSMPIRLSQEAIELLSLALEFDPARRPKDADEFAARIAQDLESARVET